MKIWTKLCHPFEVKNEQIDKLINGVIILKADLLLHQLMALQQRA